MSQGLASVSEGSSLCQTRRTTEGKGWSLRYACEKCRLGDPRKTRRREVGLLQKPPRQASALKWRRHPGSVAIGFGG